MVLFEILKNNNWPVIPLSVVPKTKGKKKLASLSMSVVNNTNEEEDNLESLSTLPKKSSSPAEAHEDLKQETDPDEEARRSTVCL